MKPTPEQIAAVRSEQNINLAKLLVQAIAIEQTIRPIVEGYQNRVLSEHEYYNDREMELGRAEITKERVLSHEQTYNMNDSDFAEYLILLDIEAAKAGLKHKEGCCPLLEAESMYRDSRNLFAESMLNSMPEFKELTLDNLLRFEPGHKKGKDGHYVMFIDSFVDLSLKLLAEDLKDLTKN